MIIVALYGIQATWDADDFEWVSADRDVANLLNATIPDTINQVDVPFREGGADKLVLEAAQTALGTDLVVIKYRDPATPPEVKDEVV